MTVPDSNKKLYLNVITWARLNQPRSLRWFMMIYISPSLPTLLNVILRHGIETYTKKYKIGSSCFAIPLEDHYTFDYIFEHVFTWTQWNGPMLKRMEKKCEEGSLERVKLCWNSSKTPKITMGKASTLCDLASITLCKERSQQAFTAFLYECLSPPAAQPTFVSDAVTNPTRKYGF